MRRRTFLICSVWIFLVLASGNLNSATFIVTNTNDSGPGSLRDALTLANSTAGTDTITFNIPGAGPHTISTLSPLPQLADVSGVLIDGFSQPGSSPGTSPPSTAVLTVNIDGTNAGSAHGFWIVTSYNTIRGLGINNFSQDGIRIQGSIAGTHDNYIYCNFVGSGITGTTPQGNGTNQSSLWAGINIIVTPHSVARYAYDNFVVDNNCADNYAEGVSISNCPPGDVYSNLVSGNYIGTDITGTVDLGNKHTGVCIAEGPHDNWIEDNLISGNDGEGASLTGYAEAGIYTYNNHLLRNIIGLDVNKQPLPNTGEGVNIGEYYGTTYQGGYVIYNEVGPGNIIACNGLSGVSVWEHYNNTLNADGNRITRNSIYRNGLLGIDLKNDGVTMNDPSDPDTGPNQELNFPVIASAIYTAGQTTITGTIDIDTNPTEAVVELFKAKRDPTGYGEGEVFLGSTTPDATGNWNVVVTGVVPSDSVTATTTDTVNFNTSEFCECVAVTGPVGVAEQSSNEQPVTYGISQNYPNPFNAETVIWYQLPRAGRVVLKVFNHVGEEVRTLVDEDKNAGSYRICWDSRDNSGKTVPSGIYMYRIQSGRFSAVKKALLIK